MRNLVHEIHRRSLWQVLGIYLAGSWVALQVVETLSESMSLPDWVQGFSVILLVLGLPIVLATAFVQEGVGRRPAGADAETSDEAGADVANAPTVAAAPAAPDRAGRVPSTGARRLFTWRRAIAGGVVAFALLGVSLVGWVVLRSLGVGPAGTLVAKGLLEERATLLLTDFEAEDASLSRAATEAIRVDLGQSSAIRLADPGSVVAALVRMERPPDEGVDLETGRELALREGMPAVIAGEVTPAGTGYVLTAQILTAETGEVLVAERVTAGDDSQLIGAIDQLSKKLRERIGESLGDLASTPALETVTTGDLEALRLYSRAIVLSDRGEGRQAADLLEEAIAIDTSFAMAWRKLGAIHTSGGGALGDYSRGIEGYERAYRHRDRLTTRERLLTTAGYFDNVEADRRRAADAYRQMLEIDPDDTWALNNLGIILGVDLGDDEEARRLLARSIELTPGVQNGYWNLSVAQGRAGMYDEAGETLASWGAALPGNALPVLFGAARSSALRRYEESDSLARVAVTVRPGNRGDEAFSERVLAGNALARGRLGAGVALMEAAERTDRELGAGRALETAMRIARVELDVRGDPASARRAWSDALARYPLDEMGPLDPPWEDLVELAARLEGPDRAREFQTRWAAAYPAAPRQPEYVVSEAWIDVAAGDGQGALRRVDGLYYGSCPTCLPNVRLEAARAVGDPALIIEHGEAFVETPELFRLIRDESRLAPALEELGRLHDEAGNLREAANYYAQFVGLWETADEELQPRVRAAQTRLDAILREIG